jgi:hypothetical protein
MVLEKSIGLRSDVLKASREGEFVYETGADYG